MTTSVRVKVVTAAALSMAMVLLVAGVVLVVLQRHSLTAGIDSALRQRADDIEAILATGGFGDGELAQVSEGFAQVVDDTGDVLASTPNLAGEAALGFGDLPVLGTFSVPIVDDDLFRVLGRTLDDGVTVYVGATFDGVGEAASALIGSLAIALPVLLVILGASTWWLVGRTLWPVEAMRAEVAVFGGDDLHRRLPTTGRDDEIDRLASTLNDMLARLEESVEGQKQFVGDASHELRSPLTRLRAQLEVEMREDSSPLLESLHEDVVGMQNIVEDLLYLARADAANSNLDAEEIDLDDIVLHEVVKVKMLSEVAIDTRAVTPVSILADQVRVGRAVTNLLDNALRHARQRVWVEVGESDGWAVVRIGDDGAGVPADAADTIFERFARADESRARDKGGTGLGLSIARSAAEAHGGSVSLVNPGEPEAVFEMRLPLTPS